MTSNTDEIEAIKLQNATNAAVLGVALSNTKIGDRKHTEYTELLDSALINESIKKITPFLKTDRSIAGYVIETDKQTMVCYHGTQFGKVLGSGGKEILNDLSPRPSNMNFGDQICSVHAGFKAEYQTSKTSLDEVLNNVLDKTHPVSFAGHSLGGAVANIAALDMATNKKEFRVGSVKTFGAPHPFGFKAAGIYNEKISETHRIIQKGDPVPALSFGYTPVGKTIILKGYGHSGASYRKKTKALETNRISSISFDISSYVSAVLNAPKIAFVAVSTEISKAIKNAQNMIKHFTTTQSTIERSPINAKKEKSKQFSK